MGIFPENDIEHGNKGEENDRPQLEYIKQRAAELLHVWKNVNSGSSVASSIQSGLGTSNNTQLSPQMGRTESRINNSEVAVKIDTSPLNLNIGEIIFHQKFGKGKITAFKENNGQVQIDFEREGSKWLSLDVAKAMLSLF